MVRTGQIIKIKGKSYKITKVLKKIPTHVPKGKVLIKQVTVRRGIR